MKGVLKNFNTIEEFKSCDKAAMLNEVADKVCALAQQQLCNSSRVDMVVYYLRF